MKVGGEWKVVARGVCFQSTAHPGIHQTHGGATQAEHLWEGAVERDQTPFGNIGNGTRLTSAILVTVVRGKVLDGGHRGGHALGKQQGQDEAAAARASAGAASRGSQTRTESEASARHQLLPAPRTLSLMSSGGANPPPTPPPVRAHLQPRVTQTLSPPEKGVTRSGVLESPAPPTPAPGAGGPAAEKGSQEPKMPPEKGFTGSGVPGVPSPRHSRPLQVRADLKPRGVCEALHACHPRTIPTVCTLPVAPIFRLQVNNSQTGSSLTI